MTWKLDRHEDLDLISNIRSEYSTNFYNFIISFIIAFTPVMLTMDRFSDQLFPHMKSRLADPNTIITGQIRPMFRWFHPRIIFNPVNVSLALFEAIDYLDPRSLKTAKELTPRGKCCELSELQVLIDLTFQRMECLWVECRLLRRLLVREVL